MFHDKKLDVIEEEYRQHIDTYHERLDKISADIKNLETLFKNAAIGEFCYEISNSQILGFCEGRIQYRDTSIDVVCQRPKPLIEHKATIRIEIAPYLSDLFEICVNLIKKGKK